jgi:hypothetical protein
MKVEQFAMERMQSTWENQVEFNLSESGVHPLTLGELADDDAARTALLNEGLRYTQSNGTIELRKAIAALYPGATPAHIQVTNVGSEANYITTWNLVEPGDEVVMMVPNYMQNGPVWKGYFHSPGYFTSDVTMAKTFKLTEKKTLQFRASAFNFLNHPLQSFNGNDYSGNSDSLSVLNAPAAGYFTPGQQLQPTDFLYNTNGTDPNFVGKPHIKKGNRLIMLGLKFEF